MDKNKTSADGYVLFCKIAGDTYIIIAVQYAFLARLHDILALSLLGILATSLFLHPRYPAECSHRGLILSRSLSRHVRFRKR